MLCACISFLDAHRPAFIKCLSALVNSLVFLSLVALRSAFSIQRASGSTTRCIGDSADTSASLLKGEEDNPSEDEKRQQNLWFPFGDWLNHSGPKKEDAQKGSSDQRYPLFSNKMLMQCKDLFLKSTQFFLLRFSGKWNLERGKCSRVLSYQR